MMASASSAGGFPAAHDAIDQGRDAAAQGEVWLAHLSDIHLSTPQQSVSRFSKTALGVRGWQRRSRYHAAASLEATVSAMRACCPDHILVTGDLIQVGQATEFREAAAWLWTVAAPEHITVVPGNHDAYRPGSWEAGRKILAPYVPVEYPVVRRIGCVLLIGLSSAVPTAVGMASGRLGAAQLDALRLALRQGRGEGLFRLVAVHHDPCMMGMRQWRKGLHDRTLLQAILQEEGAELVVHGHNHRHSLQALAGPGGPIWVVGAPSASVRGWSMRTQGGFVLYRISRRAMGFGLRLGVWPSCGLV
jgi:3',5'-cyclic AMP phosphodiesterase CpdA